MNINDSIRRGELLDVMEMVEALPEIVNQKDDKGFTPLIMATYSSQPEIAKYLLEQGADINAQDSAGNTALMGVCFKGHKDIATLLINNGADLNVMNYNNLSLIHI